MQTNAEKHYTLLPTTRCTVYGLQRQVICFQLQYICGRTHYAACADPANAYLKQEQKKKCIKLIWNGESLFRTMILISPYALWTFRLAVPTGAWDKPNIKIIKLIIIENINAYFEWNAEVGPNFIICFVMESFFRRLWLFRSVLPALKSRSIDDCTHWIIV